ncbi:hypothetical protein HDF10_000797 [Edaphobacter lichenicola]|uniref:Uncharacterized protein n=1 Tax=Tunturiibacter lichenicola TaxID=2051959 RepID=A0A7W8J584_9BACT|nr:hypothetical protein [Edaphobacter lichenicola]
MDDIKVDADKFDSVLRRMLAINPLSKAEISAKIKKERAAKKAVQKMDKQAKTDPNTTQSDPS